MILASLILTILHAYPNYYKIEFQNGIKKFCPDYKIFTHSEFFREKKINMWQDKNNINMCENEINFELKDFDVRHFITIINILENWKEDIEFGREDLIACTKLLFKLDIDNSEILNSAFTKILQKINKR